MAVTHMVTLRGPVFQNAPAKVRDGIEEILQAGVEAGEKHLDEMLRPRPSGVYLAVQGPRGSKGNYRRNVHGEVKDSLHMLITDGGVVYGPWLEGISSRNDATRFKGYASFRKTGQWLREKIGDIADGIIKGLARRLN